jgi:predicted nucleotidyltransferase
VRGQWLLRACHPSRVRRILLLALAFHPAQRGPPLSPSAFPTPGALIDALARALVLRLEVQEAYLFGSHARGEAQAHSDVDVAVWVSQIPDAPFGYEAGLAADLMAALGESRVDVVLLNRAPPLLAHEAICGVRIFARDLRATTVREGRAISRYCDWLPQLAKIDRALRRRLAAGEFGR